MKTNSPTHEEIARLAQEIWNARGNPNGCDIANWLEAERQLTGTSPRPPDSDSAGPNSSPGDFGRNLTAAGGGRALAEPVDAKPAADRLASAGAPPTSPDEIAAKTAFQHKTSRAPQFPAGNNAPKPTPTESGKPLWNQPHSS